MGFLDPFADNGLIGWDYTSSTAMREAILRGRRGGRGSRGFLQRTWRSGKAGVGARLPDEQDEKLPGRVQRRRIGPGMSRQMKIWRCRDEGSRIYLPLEPCRMVVV